MNAIELMNANREKIVEALKAAERKSYLYPSCEYRVYIDTNGDAGDEEWLAHDNAWFEFRNGYFRHYIHTFCNQYYDILWDWWFDDPSNALSEFKQHFGYDVEQDPYAPYSEDMKNTALAHGVPPADYDKWLEEQTETAIKELISNNAAEGFYDNIIDEVIEGEDAADD